MRHVSAAGIASGRVGSRSYWQRELSGVRPEDLMECRVNSVCDSRPGTGGNPAISLRPFDAWTLSAPYDALAIAGRD